QPAIKLKAKSSRQISKSKSQKSQIKIARTHPDQPNRNSNRLICVFAPDHNVDSATGLPLGLEGETLQRGDLQGSSRSGRTPERPCGSVSLSREHGWTSLLGLRRMLLKLPATKQQLLISFAGAQARIRE